MVGYITKNSASLQVSVHHHFSSHLTMPKFSLFYIPALFVGTAFVLGPGLPMWSSQWAMLEFGLPETLATQEPAQAVFPIHGSRVQFHGLCIWIFYLQGKLEVVDTLLVVLLYAGAFDWYICWREGMPGFWTFGSAVILLSGAAWV